MLPTVPLELWTGLWDSHTRGGPLAGRVIPPNTYCKSFLKINGLMNEMNEYGDVVQI